jgi:hypothetical protein
MWFVLLVKILVTGLGLVAGDLKFGKGAGWIRLPSCELAVVGQN